MAKRVVVDPVTRIEGHLRIEAMLDDRGVIRDAISSGTMWRGIELILKGRDPRDAWAICERICGVCTTVHALASVRAVENALKIRVPKNAEIIRNIMFLSQMVQDHVIHFYHLHALDWVDVVSSLKADPEATFTLAQKVSPHWPTSSPGYFRDTQATIKKFVDSGQLGIFANAYWGHPAYKLPPEANLMAVAHYLEALRWQKDIAAIHAVFGGKNPHPNYLVGGVPSVVPTEGATGGLDMERLNLVRSRITEAIRVAEEMYVPDLLAIASFYPEWAKIGGGLRNYMTYGDLPLNGIDDLRQFRFPAGVVVNRDISHTLPVNLADDGQVREEVAHSWYDYPDAGARQPWQGITEPRYTGPRPPYQELDETAKYSWLKAPRWKGQPMEVGPLARVLVGYAAGRADFKEAVDDVLKRLKLPAAALFSTLGRTAARGIETRLAARWLLAEYERLVANIKSGDTATASTSAWDPKTWPAEAKGFGFTEAPRGALCHWIRIRDCKIHNYQIVVPSTWNASPKDGKGQHGAYEAALLETPLADPQRPVEILRTIHSFDPCLACASHVLGPDGRKLAEVVVY